MTIPRPVYRVLAVLWTILILVGTLMPQNEIQRRVGKETTFLNIPHSDKAIHFLLFAGFVVLWWMAVEKPRARVAVLLGAAVLLAVGTELGQAIPGLGRDAGLDDLVADLAGVGLAFWGMSGLTRSERVTASA